jgi:anti-sigma factor RsiW
LDETTVRQYLLDELPADEREQLEMRLLTDDDFFAHLLGLEETQEDELIEQYVNGELSGREREKFQQVFLTKPERQEKLKLVKDLSAYAAAPAQPVRSTAKRKKGMDGWFPAFLAFFNFRRPLLSPLLASALALMVLSSAWLFFKVRGLESEVSRLKAGRASAPSPAPDQDVQRQLAELRARNDELAAALRRAEEERDRLSQEVASLKSQEVRQPAPPAAPPQQRGAVFSIILPLVHGRDTDQGGARELKLPHGPARVQLLLDLDVIDPGEYKSYRVLIRKRDGTVTWRDNQPRLQTRGGENRLVVDLPADRLPEGEYLAELSGLSGGVREVIGVYTFRSSKQ